MKTWVYVDGFNLYYGAVKNTPYKWLDLSALCARVLPAPFKTDKIRYFTARVSDTGNPGASRRQHAYLKAVAALPGVEIHYGGFLSKTLWRPLINLPVAGRAILSAPPVTLPPGQHEVDNGPPRQQIAVGCYPDNTKSQSRAEHGSPPPPNPVIVKVRSSEEKGSDVNLASHLLNDAWHGRFEAAAVITNDTDFIEPIRIVTQERKKPVCIVCPGKWQPAPALAQAATHVRRIHRNMLINSQFPDPVPGSNIRKPAEW